MQDQPTFKRRRRERLATRCAALAIAAVLLVAPTVASARPIDSVGIPGANVLHASPAPGSSPAVSPVDVSESDGFDWTDAAIGAGGAAGAIVLGLGAAVGVRSLRARSPRAREA
jgi:hypothetical protein